MLKLNFKKLTDRLWQARANDFTVSRERTHDGPEYALAVSPESYPYIVRAIESKRLDAECLKMKPGSRYGLYESKSLEAIEQFVETTFMAPVFLNYGHVVIWHHRKPCGLVLDYWYSVSPDDDEAKFRLEDLGIGGLCCLYQDLPISARYERWLDAIKVEFRLLIEEGHITQDKPPLKVNDSHSKAFRFSTGSFYGHRHD